VHPNPPEQSIQELLEYSETRVIIHAGDFNAKRFVNFQEDISNAEASNWKRTILLIYPGKYSTLLKIAGTPSVSHSSASTEITIQSAVPSRVTTASHASGPRASTSRVHPTQTTAVSLLSSTLPFLKATLRSFSVPCKNIFNSPKFRPATIATSFPIGTNHWI